MHFSLVYVYFSFNQTRFFSFQNASYQKAFPGPVSLFGK